MSRLHEREENPMRKLWKTIFILLLIIVVAGVVLKVWDYLAGRHAQIGKIKDEAALAGRTPESMPGADEDYFADMDNGVTKLHPEEVQKTLNEFIPGISQADAVKAAAIGRNNWNVWSAGN